MAANVIGCNLLKVHFSVEISILAYYTTFYCFTLNCKCGIHLENSSSVFLQILKYSEMNIFLMPYVPIDIFSIIYFLLIYLITEDFQMVKLYKYII